MKDNFFCKLWLTLDIKKCEQLKLKNIYAKIIAADFYFPFPNQTSMFSVIKIIKWVHTSYLFQTVKNIIQIS